MAFFGPLWHKLLDEGKVNADDGCICGDNQQHHDPYWPESKCKLVTVIDVMPQSLT